MMDEIRWGIIGCGDVTEVKSGPAFNRVEHSSLVAVMRRDGEKARDYALRHQVPRWYDQVNALIDDPEVNAIYIATPPDAHCDYTLRAARAGKPVYVEKPMARTHAECLKMIEGCQHAGVSLFVAYYRRCLPLYLKVQELITNGVIGSVRFVSIQLVHSAHEGDEHQPWRVRPEIAGGGHFYDLASHQLDALDFLLGPVTAVGGQSANQAGLYPAEDIVTASWRHASGALGSGVWCFTAAPGRRTDLTEITGSQGRLSFSFFESQPLVLETSHGVEEIHFPRQDPIQQPLIQTVVDDLRGVGHCPSTAESGARTNAVMEKIVTL
jgi:predicted dehydrogenase